MKLREANRVRGIMARSPRRRSTSTKTPRLMRAAKPTVTDAVLQPLSPEPTVRAQVSAPRPKVAAKPAVEVQRLCTQVAILRDVAPGEHDRRDREGHVDQERCRASCPDQ